MGKLKKLVKILEMLERGERVTPKRLANELGVSERTVYRYINSLQQVGFPVKYDKEKASYVAEFEGKLPSKEVLIVLYFSKKTLKPVLGEEVNEVIESLLKKLYF